MSAEPHDHLEDVISMRRPVTPADALDLVTSAGEIALVAFQCPTLTDWEKAEVRRVYLMACEARALLRRHKRLRPS